ncbi:hypothetical protein [Candidatus Pelagibacter communis]|uniref:hypothetical protein n=1 Tax=Pelagibacter ubique TaxID=198252 RepID=UPI00094DB9D7|nr:hypothetical protein [Candidatus Pelagibacter ubique]
MKKSHKIFDEYNIDLELDNSSRLYKSWNEKWLDYLRNLNGVYENQFLKDVKFNIIEHYTEDGLEKGDFDPSSKKTIRDGKNYKIVDLFSDQYNQLFLEFINLKLNVSSIHNFINKYGTLGSPVVQRKYSEQDANEYKSNTNIQGELLQCWYVEIKNLQSLLKNYQYYIQKDYKSLNEKFNIVQKQDVYYWSFKETENIEEKFPLIINLFSRNYNYPVTISNKKIDINKDNIDQIFTEYSIEVIKKFYSERTRAYIDVNNSWFNTKFEPKGLIGFIWHQAIKSIEDKNQIKNCKYCSKEFVIGQGLARKDKEFCSISHAVLSKREDNISNNISKIFIKKGYEIKPSEKDSLFDFVVFKNKKKISGINISLSESLDNKSKKWNFLIQKKIKEPMFSEGLHSAYLINKNLDCFLFNKNNDRFKKLKSPMDYDSLNKFIKSNEKETKNK